MGINSISILKDHSIFLITDQFSLFLVLPLAILDRNLLELVKMIGVFLMYTIEILLGFCHFLF